MTDSEREEFVYDVASHLLSNISKAGLMALAIDRVSDFLLTKSDDELIEMAPACLTIVPDKTKAKRNKAKPTGF
tara:strand:- start:170 stop:391 length:222 start_codon:yes stop_codon:yes gene_type:complete